MLPVLQTLCLPPAADHCCFTQCWLLDAHSTRFWLLCVLQQQDRMPAAAALSDSWRKLQQQQQGPQQQPDQQQQQQHPAGSSSSSGGGGASGSDQDTQQQRLQRQQQQQQADRAVQSSKQLMSQAQLSQLLQQQLGYSLSVRPSNITHEEAGEWAV
jgi:hypothetical protein